MTTNENRVGFESRRRSWIVYAALLFPVAGLSLGCGSTNDASNRGSPAAAGDAGGPTEYPNARHCGISTEYPGDEYCIEAPDPSVGLQLHYGPKDYSDREEVERYLLYPGEEKTDCVFVKTGNETEVFFAGYHSRMRPGSHHMLLYVQETLRTDSSAPENCRQGIDTRNIFGAQTLAMDVERLVRGPENDGLAVKLGPKLQGVVQMHFINTGDKPILREGWANILYVDPSEVKILGDPIFFLGGLSMNVQPGKTEIIKGTATAPADVRLVMATGHFHAHTTRFSAWKTVAGARERILEDYDWHEPSLVHFNSATENPQPDPVRRTVGGYSGRLDLKQGDVIDWECEVVNDGDVPLTFGNEVYTAEMCNVFGLYAPTTGSAWRAVN